MKPRASAAQIDAWLAHARERRKAGEPREAIAIYRKALEGGAPAAQTHLQLGVLHAELREYDAAIGELRASLAITPGESGVIAVTTGTPRRPASRARTPHAYP